MTSWLRNLFSKEKESTDEAEFGEASFSAELSQAIAKVCDRHGVYVDKIVFGIQNRVWNDPSPMSYVRLEYSQDRA